MQSDGQLYSPDDSISPPLKHTEQGTHSLRMPFGGEELMLLGIIYLVMSDKSKSTDIALIAALVYILLK